MGVIRLILVALSLLCIGFSPTMLSMQQAAVSVLECDAVAPDQFCEDFDDSVQCLAGDGRAAVCRFGWEIVTEGGGGVIDFDSELNMAANTCDYKGTYVLDAFLDDASADEASILFDFEDDATNYLYFQIFTDDIGCVNGGAEYVPLVWMEESGGAAVYSFYLQYDGVDVQWFLYNLEDFANVGAGGTAAPNTWYEVIIFWDASQAGGSDVAWVKVATLGGVFDKVIEDAAMDLGRWPGQVRIGANADTDSTTGNEDLRVQYAVISANEGAEVVGCDP